jgi:cation transport ATPase
MSALCCDSGAPLKLSKEANLRNTCTNLHRRLIKAVRLEVASEILVARDGRLLGAIAVADTVRPEARCAVAAFADMRLRSILLTGDTKAVAGAVARSLGIGEIEADLLPEDKLARIKELVARGRVVAMLGAGINDARHSPRPPSASPWDQESMWHARARISCCSATRHRRLARERPPSKRSGH